MARVFANEWRMVLHDQGVLIFFALLPVLYPVVYTLIYNPEVVREMPIAVVDHDRTAASRKLVRDASAAPALSIYDYVPDLPAARELMAEGRVFGILEIPEGYGKHIGRLEQSHATFYSQMSLLLRYRSFMSAMTDVQLKDIGDITQERQDMLGEAGTLIFGSPIRNEAHMLGDTEQGFASFVMPGIVVLILQQSMVLGICLLMGTSRERRRRNGGIDPLAVQNVPVTATVWGRTLCYFTFYIAPTLFLLHWVPMLFNLPHYGSAVQYLLFAVPLLLSSAFFGQTVGCLCKTRESCFIVVVFTSVVFLFLSGLTWPRYAFPAIWTWTGNMIPGVWGVEGFIRINSNAGTLAENSEAFLWMWGLTAFYFVLSALVLYAIRHSKKFCTFAPDERQS